MASRNAASATSRDTNRALERISAAVRSLSFALSCSWSLNRPSFAAQGQKCFRDSYGKPQCGEKPPCDKPGYEPCPGEDFCCRASTLLTLNGLSHSTFLHFQQRGRSALATLTGSQRAVILNSRKAVTVTMITKTVITMIRRSWHGDRAPRRLYSPRSLQIPTVVDPIVLRRPLFDRCRSTPCLFCWPWSIRLPFSKEAHGFSSPWTSLRDFRTTSCDFDSPLRDFFDPGFRLSF